MNISGSGKYKKAIRKAPSVYYQPSRRREEQKSFNWKLFWHLTRIILPLLIIVYVFYWSPIFKIKDIIVSGNSYISTERIVSVLPRKANIFSLDTEELRQELQQQIPEIEDVKIYKGIPDALKVIISENQGAIVWQSGINYYLISKSGIAFREISNDLGSYATIPKVVDTRSVPVLLSQKVVSQDFVDFAQYIYSNIKEEDNLDPDYFSIGETTVDLNLITKNNMYIKFDSLRSSQKQLDDLKLVLMEKKSEVTEYIDMRVSGWSYYK